MSKLIRNGFLAAALCLAALPARSASLTLPSVTVTTSASTSIACVPTAASYPAPLAVGSIVFTCSVQPAGWSGAVSISGSGFGVTSLSGAGFNVAVVGSALAAGSYAPGTLTSSP